MGRTRHGQRWLAWLRRRAGLDANPIRRVIDRTETWIRLSLLAVFLAGAPALALGLSHWTGQLMTGQARAQAAREYLVPATLLAGSRPATQYPGAGASYSWAPAQWTAHDGARRAGQVDVRDGARKGSVVRVWTNASGRLVSPPLAHAQIVSRVVTVGLLAPIGLALLLLTAAGTVHRILDRRRMAAWEADWLMVEPQWTRRLR